MVVIQKKTREYVYFTLLFTLYFLTIRLRKYIGKISTSTEGGSSTTNNSSKVKKSSLKQIMLDMLFSFVYASIIIGVYYLVNLSGAENFWDITPAAKCKGGSYFWQGDSQNSEMCRELDSTPEGNALIAGYNCPSGQVGQPGLNKFVYTPLSGDNWTNEQCEEKV